MKAHERLTRYVKVFTQSDPDCARHPSSRNQFDLAYLLRDELEALGVKDAQVDEYCLVYGHLEATKGCENEDRIGFIAHMDTAPDFTGKDVKPVFHKDYDGGVLPLGQSGRALDPAVFPHLKNLRGRTLITSDGTTLLGADDKAGIAEIMTMIERLKEEKIPHGRISVCFTPDEEVGMGTDCFDLEKFGADYAYTVDGGVEGEVVCENFNAASALWKARGVNVHPGSAKDVMVNASRLICECVALLPPDEVPEKTEGYEGFFHLTDLKGDVAQAEAHLIIRDHDRARFEARKALFREIADRVNEKHGGAYLSCEVTDSYYNMAEKIKPLPQVEERALEAVKKAGLTPVTDPIRGGTDGAHLSYMGLPTPNLGTGGYAFHGPFEHITAEGMEISTQILVHIARARKSD